MRKLKGLFKQEGEASKRDSEQVKSKRTNKTMTVTISVYVIVAASSDKLLQTNV